MIGKITLLPSYKETGEWTNKLAGSLGAFLRAGSPAEITAEYEKVDLTSLSPQLHAVIHNDATADGAVKSMQKWLGLMEKGAGKYKESVVDRFVGELAHVCDLDDGKNTQLLPQEVLRFRLGELQVASKPDHVLRTAPGLFDVLIQESKKDDDWQLAWGQVVGEILAAALVNTERAPDLAMPPPIFAIRVIETRWTFMRADFTADYLERVENFQLRPDDRFNVTVWGGPPGSGGQNQTDEEEWGLNYRNAEERAQLVRMLVALGRETRAQALRLGRRA